MSFLKIKDPVKREQTVKEYLATMKRIRDNQLTERTGDIELQTDLSKFFRPITETQKVATKEITEGLKPIKEGIEQLPQAITFPAFPSIIGHEETEDKDKDKDKDENKMYIGPIAAGYLRKFASTSADTTFGLRDVEGKFYIGDKLAIIDEDDIIVGKEIYEGTPGFWELLVSKKPDESKYDDEDLKNYSKLIKQTNSVYIKNDPYREKVRSSKSYKWTKIIRPIWEEIKAEKEATGEGITVIPSDPNALLERLDLLMASKGAGHTGVRNELVSICDELKRQRILDTKTYKKLMSIL